MDGKIQQQQQQIFKVARLIILLWREERLETAAFDLGSFCKDLWVLGLSTAFIILNRSSIGHPFAAAFCII